MKIRGTYISENEVENDWAVITRPSFPHQFSECGSLSGWPLTSLWPANATRINFHSKYLPAARETTYAAHAVAAAGLDFNQKKIERLRSESRSFSLVTKSSD